MMKRHLLIETAKTQLLVVGFTLLCWCAQSALAQRETGLPFLQNFRPKDYGGLPQNWSIAQDERGLIYFANNSGVLEFDGATWRVIPLPGLSEAYSLARDAHGRIWVGGNNDLGYLAADERGQMRFNSLVTFVPDSLREFGQVWKIVSNSDGIFFETMRGVFRLRHTPERPAAWTVNVWKLDRSFYLIHAIGEQIYFSRTRRLYALRGDSLHLLVNHEAVTKAALAVMLPDAEAAGQAPRLLAGTRKQGLFWYDGATLQPFASEADEYLRENEISHGVVLPQGRFAFATLFGGVVIIDRNGRLLQIVNKAAGLHNENILNVFADREGGLWLGTDSGIARIETSTPLSLFTEAVGLNGSLYSITRHRNRLYLGTSAGLAYLAEENSPTHTPILKPVPAVTAQTRALLSLEKTLLVGGSDGIFQLDENHRLLQIDQRNPGAFCRSKKYPERVYVGLMDALAVLLEAESKQPMLLPIPGVAGDVRYIVEDSTGALWVSMYPNGLARVELPREMRNEILATETKVENFGPANGLPEGWSEPVALGNRIVFATPKAVHRFVAMTRTFKIDSSLGAFFADTSRAFSSLAEDAQHQIWMTHTQRNREEFGVAARGTDGVYVWQPQPFSRATELGYAQMLYPDPVQRGVVWFPTEEALVRYDQAAPSRESDIEFFALVRRVRAKGDTLIYGGAAQRGETAIAYANNALRFEYGAPTFDHVRATRYQYLLEGFDEGWSEWSAETKKEYTNLPEGDYRFRVRAQNVYDRLSNADVFAFKILPPWYRTWWAYGFYFLCAGTAVLSLLRWRVRALNERARQLETTIAARTAEVVVQKNRLLEQAEQLREMDRVKSRFFANISHELRTPLTLILGPLDRVLRGAEKHSSLDDTRMMHRNATNLLRLVNQLLDLAKLEAGEMRLQAHEGDLGECLNDCVAAFASAAKNKKIALQWHPPDAPLMAWFHRTHMEEVFSNLLSNALKFTPEGGKISVQLSVATDQLSVNSDQLSVNQLNTEHWSLTTGNWTLISVKDTGSGIPAAEHSRIFERFYQAANSRQVEGTGIGLALVKELVELHHGRVVIASREGEGTEVSVWLPLGREHLRAEEIATLPHAPETRLPAAPLSEPEAEHEASNEPLEPEKIILLVEDNSDMRAYLRRELQPEYRVLEASDGVEGLRLAREIIPDLVISDIMMPRMDGYALCARIKFDEKTSHIPVILLTARAEQEDRLEGLQTGADDYLTKPFDGRELQLRIKNLIALRHKLQERLRKLMLLHPREIQVTSPDDAFLQKAVAVVEAHIEEEAFAPEDLAREMGMSRAQFYRKLRALTNQPAGLFIRTLRLERAAELLKKGAGSIAEVAYRVGFSSHPYFSKCFHEHFGMSPKDYLSMHGS